MCVKWLRRLEDGDRAWHHREETSKYTDLLANGKARRFTWLMDVKSVITSPSPQAPVTHGRGALVISGLAWSGNGTVRRVAGRRSEERRGGTECVSTCRSRGSPDH